MKHIAITFCAAALFAACDSGTKTEEPKIASATTTEKTAPADEWVAVDSATAMKNMMEAGTPSPAHAMLAKANGDWDVEATMWMAPGAPPQTSKATATYKMMYGGRYQQMQYKGDFGGMPFEGVSTTGYDNAAKTYFSTWMDNMSTAMMYSQGTSTDGGKTISFKGRMVCPANGKECEMREVYKVVDDNTHMMEMYGPDLQTGKEYKNMEMKLTRKKK